MKKSLISDIAESQNPEYVSLQELFRNWISNQIVGMTLQEAQKWAANNDFKTRTIETDGIPLIGDCQIRNDRIGLTLRNNVVLRIEIG